jgi:hypothetical protein
LHVRQRCWASVDFFGIWRYLNLRARYPSGKGEVCKTFMRRFDSDPRLQKHLFYLQGINSDIAAESSHPHLFPSIQIFVRACKSCHSTSGHVAHWVALKHPNGTH